MPYHTIFTRNSSYYLSSTFGKVSHVWLFCHPMDCRPPISTAHWIFQARIVECVAISSSRGSFQHRDRICVSCMSRTDRWILYHWATRKLNSKCEAPFPRLHTSGRSCRCWLWAVISFFFFNFNFILFFNFPILYRLEEIVPPNYSRLKESKTVGKHDEKCTYWHSKKI